MANAYKRWTMEDEAYLQKSHGEYKIINDIANELGRSVGACLLRLKSCIKCRENPQSPKYDVEELKKEIKKEIKQELRNEQYSWCYKEYQVY